MSEEFTHIGIEVFINGVWVDLAPDVRSIPSPSVAGIGIMSNNPLERVGNVSSFNFSLDNSEKNSHATRGYYTPGGANSLNGWNSGLYVRLYFVYDNIYKGVFYGRIDVDGISVTSGVYSNRDVQVRASGWMREASERSIEMIDYQTNKRSDQAVSLVLENMPVRPLVQSFQTGVETFLTIFDITRANTKAVSEFTKIVDSEFGFVYTRGDHSPSAYVGGETLVFENRQWRYAQRDTPSYVPLHSSFDADDILLETGDRLLLEDGGHTLLETSQLAYFSEADFEEFTTAYGKHLYNRARMTSYPRRIDQSPVVLWNLEGSMEIKAGNSIRGLRGSYRDPSGQSTRVSGINMIAPVTTTDYLANSLEDGTGTNLTADVAITAMYGTAEVEYTLTNTGATDMFITLLQARGYGVYTYNTASILYESRPSMDTYGVHEIQFELPYISDATNMFRYANNADRVLLESGDKLLLENGDYLKADDTAGIFDLLVFDEPTYYIESATLFANRDKFNMMAFMTLDAGSFVKLQDTMTEITTDYTYCINGYDMEISEGKYAKWKPTLISSLRFPRI